MAQVCASEDSGSKSFFLLKERWSTMELLGILLACLRLHLIDRRKDRPEKLPAPFYYPSRGPIKSWTRIPKDLVLKEPPTRYFSREMFMNSRASDPRRLNLCQNFFQFPILAADTMKTALFSSSFFPPPDTCLYRPRLIFPKIWSTPAPRIHLALRLKLCKCSDSSFSR